MAASILADIYNQHKRITTKDFDLNSFVSVAIPKLNRASTVLLISQQNIRIFIYYLHASLNKTKSHTLLRGALCDVHLTHSQMDQTFVHVI